MQVGSLETSFSHSRLLIVLALVSILVSAGDAKSDAGGRESTLNHGVTAGATHGGEVDSDQDGIADIEDSCPAVIYDPPLDWTICDAMDLNPDNDFLPECKARERVADLLLHEGAFITHIAFSVTRGDRVHFADAFEYIGNGQFIHDPSGIHRLYRIGSTSKPVTATAAKVLEESGQLSFYDYVNDDDATQVLVGGERTLLQLLTHQGAFKTDYGAIHLFCYPYNLASFWLEPDDHVSPHYDSAEYGNLGGGYQYSAFNYSLAGAYLASRTATPFAEILQTRVFDSANMCTATLDGDRAASTTIGEGVAVSQGAGLHVGPYINLVSPTDELCEDNFYSSDDVYGEEYTWQPYRLDEAASEARDPAGGVIASVVDLAHFAESLLSSYHQRDSLMSLAGIRQLWEATVDLGCYPNCPYDRYYGIGFFTGHLPDAPIVQVEHGGSRPGHTTAFVLRPEADMAVSIVANADASTVTMSNLAKTILNDLALYDNPADLNLDGAVDLADAAVFTECMAGPGIHTPPPGCSAAAFYLSDLDGDRDADAGDFAVIANHFGG